MIKRIFTTGLLLCLFSWSVWSQVAMGKWRTHFAYNNVSQIAQSENKIFAVSEGALFSVDKQDMGLEFYSKLSGLYGANISRIEYDKSSHQLLIIYLNGNIDILATSGVSNIPDFYNKQMSANKDVNHIFFYQDKAYLSCNFGIIVLNMQKKEVADTYFIGPNASEVKVLNTTVLKSTIYALTSTSLYKASVTEPHLVNYAFWLTATGLPGSGDMQSVVSFAGQLFLLRSSKLYRQDSSDNWTAFLPSLFVTNLNVSNGSLNIFTENAVNLVDTLLNVKTISNFGTITDVEYDTENETYWFAANESGIKSYKQTGSDNPVIDSIKPAGPAVNIPYSMTFSGKKLFVVPGGRWASPDYRMGAVMIYENGNWTNIYGKDIQKTTEKKVLDFMNVAVDPKDDKHFFVTSYGTGLYEFKDNNFYKWHNFLNSTIESHPAVPTEPYLYMRLDGAVFDKNGNLLFSNCAVAASIKILLADGNWAQLKYPNINKETLGKIQINNQNENQKWVLSVRSGEIIIFDDNGTLVDQTDDKSVIYKSFNDPDNDGTLLSPTTCYAIAQDKNGVMWVGTEQGPFLYYNPSKAFDPGFSCSRVKIPRNDGSGLADYLLVSEKIKAIAIDGANRKWLGTESSGVYLMSENGQETIQHFTTANSPLLSNDIISITINPVTGEVFFGTGQGIVSYQSDAGEAGETFSNVYAYPNPVRENYTGIITITGLVQDTQVKITDLNGNLICETVSNGSIATWDGKDTHGRKVSTGIYLAICASADGTQSTITKILVIN